MRCVVPRGALLVVPRGALLVVPRGALLVAAMALSAAAIAADRIEVDQKDRAFAVEDVRMHAGGTIVFSNKDDFDHQIYIVSPGFSFESDEAAPGQTVSVSIPVSGTFEVRCHIHPKMHLNVTVN